MARIKDYDTTTTLEDDDAFIVDNETDGTRIIKASKLVKKLLHNYKLYTSDVEDTGLTDADELPSNSIYRIGSDSTAATWSNVPESKAAMLVTLDGSTSESSTRRYQLWWRNDSTNRLYIRNEANGTWNTSWQRIITDEIFEDYSSDLVDVSSWSTPVIMSSTVTINSGGYFKTSLNHGIIQISCNLATAMTAGTEYEILRIPAASFLATTSIGADVPLRASTNGKGFANARLHIKSGNTNYLYINVTLSQAGSSGDTIYIAGTVYGV